MNHEKFTPSELESQISDIMKRFDFEKVQEHMAATDHRWWMGGEHNSLRVPDLDDLRWQARSLLTQAAWSEEKVTNVGTGGFMAYKMPWGMSLVFQLAWS
jgi:hypothetical protein